MQPEFSSIPVTRRRHPDNEQKNRDAQFAPKNGQKPKPSVTPQIVVGLFAGFWTACHRAPTFFERGGRAWGPSATIVADVKRFCHRIKTDEVFGTRISAICSSLIKDITITHHNTHLSM